LLTTATPHETTMIKAQLVAALAEVHKLKTLLKKKG
jgi:hypothetical protein